MSESAYKRRRATTIYPGRSAAARRAGAASRVARTNRVAVNPFAGAMASGLSRANLSLASTAGIYGGRVARAARMRENKTFDCTANPVTITNTFNTDGVVAPSPFAFVDATSAWCLNQVPIGNSSVTRVGRRFSCTALALRGSIYAGSTGTTALATLVLVWDRKPNNGTVIPAFATVFKSQDALSLTNKDNAPRFKILRRWDYVINGDEDAASTNETTRIRFDEFIKMKNKVTILTTADTDGSLPDMVEGSLLLYAIGSGAKSTAQPTLRICSRLYFEDN